MHTTYTKAAGQTWKTTGSNFEGIIDGLPVIGHAKGGIHYAVGYTVRGHQVTKSASRTTGVIGSGVAGFIVTGNLFGAAAGGVAGGVAMDGLITGTDSAVHGEYRPNGQITRVSDIIQGKSSSGSVLDTVLNFVINTFVNLLHINKN